MTGPGSTGRKESVVPSDDPRSQNRDPEVRKRFFGKYRGSVVENIDPSRQGRLLLKVPDVFGIETSNWAMPCVPLAGLLMGTSFVPPPLESSVWVEFEQGDRQHPIWVGCFWDIPFTLGKMAMVAGLAATPSVTLETEFSGIGISDASTGNVSLYAAEGATSISLNAAGVTITAPTVTINGAVVVTGDLTVNGAAEVDGDLDVNGAAEVDGDLAVNGAAEVDGDLDVNGAAEVNGALDVNGALAVIGAATVDGIVVP